VVGVPTGVWNASDGAILGGRSIGRNKLYLGAGAEFSLPIRHHNFVAEQ
jgi:hypothetical protein